jgi:hypothetical protein
MTTQTATKSEHAHQNAEKKIQKVRELYADGPRQAQYHPEPRFETRRAVQTLQTYNPFFGKRTEPAGAAPNEISFGSFRLLPTRFLLLEGDKPVPLGSRAL